MKVIEQIKYDIKDQGNAKVTHIAALVEYYEASEAWFRIEVILDRLRKARAELEEEDG